VLTRCEQRDEPEDGGGTDAACGHIGHGRYPVVEEDFGNRDAESENHVGQQHGGMAFQFCSFHHGGKVRYILTVGQVFSAFIQDYGVLSPSFPFIFLIFAKWP
jgi:hypothetical protein